MRPARRDQRDHPGGHRQVQDGEVESAVPHAFIVRAFRESSACRQPPDRDAGPNMDTSRAVVMV